MTNHANKWSNIRPYKQATTNSQYSRCTFVIPQQQLAVVLKSAAVLRPFEGSVRWLSVIHALTTGCPFPRVTSQRNMFGRMASARLAVPVVRHSKAGVMLPGARKLQVLSNSSVALLCLLWGHGLQDAHPSL